jgi:hypothetical protein
MHFFYFRLYMTKPKATNLPLDYSFARSAADIESFLDLARAVDAEASIDEVVVESKNARQWVDIMDTYKIWIHLFSEQVVQMVEEEDFRGIEFFPVQFGRVESRFLRARRPWPKYFVGRVTGRIAADMETYEGEPLAFDEQTGFYKTKGLGGLHRARLRPETWDGSDFMHVSTFYTSHRLCTARVKEAVERRKLSNFNFIAEEAPNIIVF